MAVSWICGGFGLIDYKYFYPAGVFVLYQNDQQMTRRLEEAAFTPTDVWLDVFLKVFLIFFV